MSQINTLIFATGNKNKAREASEILGFELITPEQEIEIPEIQLESNHWKEIEGGNFEIASDYVAGRKALDAYKAYGQIVLIEDIALYIPALKGRPGTDIKAWCDEQLLEFLCKAAHDNGDICVTAICTLAIAKKDNTVRDNNLKNNTIQFWHGRVDGTLAKKPIGEQKGAFGWDRIFCPNDSKLTYAQDLTQKQNSPRALAFKALKEKGFN